MLELISENQNSHSLAYRSRAKRFQFFKSQLNKLPRPLKILDIGGTQCFWDMMGFDEADEVRVYLLNLDFQEVSSPHFVSLKGDATDLSEFEDNYFDVVFSNSVIEHLYSWENQEKMAREVVRVGKNYFVQTPNYWFPIEPHFVFPFFQYLPSTVKLYLLTHFSLGHYPRCKCKADAVNTIKEIQLLSERQLKALFKESNIYYDKFMGLNKSFVAYHFN